LAYLPISRSYSEWLRNWISSVLWLAWPAFRRAVLSVPVVALVGSRFAYSAIRFVGPPPQTTGLIREIPRQC
jgi:hypothetical protein